MTKKHATQLKNRILKSINAGKAHMKPKWHFVLRAVLLIAGTLIAAIALLYLSSFIVFALRQSGVLFVSGFGLTGLHVFVSSLPWVLIGAALVFVVILELLVKRYAFAYRMPLLYSLAAVIVFVVGASFVVAQTNFHERFLDQARHGRLPTPARQLYSDFGDRHVTRVHPGIVVEITHTGFMMENHLMQPVNVLVNERTRYRRATQLETGDHVVVMGRLDPQSEADDETRSIQAIGIRSLRGMRPILHEQIKLQRGQGTRTHEIFMK